MLKNNVSKEPQQVNKNITDERTIQGSQAPFFVTNEQPQEVQPESSLQQYYELYSPTVRFVGRCADSLVGLQKRTEYKAKNIKTLEMLQDGEKAYGAVAANLCKGWEKNSRYDSRNMSVSDELAFFYQQNFQPIGVERICEQVMSESTELNRSEIPRVTDALMDVQLLRDHINRLMANNFGEILDIALTDEQKSKVELAQATLECDLSEFEPITERMAEEEKLRIVEKKLKLCVKYLKYFKRVILKEGRTGEHAEQAKEAAEKERILTKAEQMGFVGLFTNEEIEVHGGCAEIKGYCDYGEHLNEFYAETDSLLGKKYQKHINEYDLHMHQVSEEAVVSALVFAKAQQEFDQQLSTLPQEQSVSRQILTAFGRTIAANDKAIAGQIERSIAARSGFNVEGMLASTMLVSREQAIVRNLLDTGATISLLSGIRLAQVENLNRLIQLTQSGHGELLLDRFQALLPMIAYTDKCFEGSIPNDQLIAEEERLKSNLAVQAGASEMLTAQFTQLGVTDYAEVKTSVPITELRRQQYESISDYQQNTDDGAAVLTSLLDDYRLSEKYGLDLTKNEQKESDKREESFAKQVMTQYRLDWEAVLMHGTLYSGFKGKDSVAASLAGGMEQIIVGFANGLSKADFREKYTEIDRNDQLDYVTARRQKREVLQQICSITHGLAELCRFSMESIRRIDKLEKTADGAQDKQNQFGIMMMKILGDRLEGDSRVNSKLSDPDFAHTIIFQASALLQGAMQMAENKTSDHWFEEVQYVANQTKTFQSDFTEKSNRSVESRLEYCLAGAKLDLEQGEKNPETLNAGDLENLKRQIADYEDRLARAKEESESFNKSMEKMEAEAQKSLDRRSAFLADSSDYRRQIATEEQKIQQVNAHRAVEMQKKRAREEAERRRIEESQKKDDLLRVAIEQAKKRQEQEAEKAQRQMNAELEKLVMDRKRLQQHQAKLEQDEQAARLKAEQRAAAKLARKQRAEQPKQIKQETHNAAFAEVASQLALYVPTDAVGKLAKYEVEGRTEAGVGKGTVMVEKMFGGIKTSKLSQRIGEHVKRFLYSDEIEPEHIAETAREVVNASGLYSNKCKNNCTPQAMGGEVAEPVNLLDRVQHSANLAADAGLMGQLRSQLAGEEGIDSLDVPFIYRSGDNTQVVAMYLLSKQLCGKLDNVASKVRVELKDRFTAIRQNLEPLYNELTRRPEYVVSKAQLGLNTVKQQLNDNMKKFNELQADIAVVAKPITILDTPEEYIEQLHLERDFSVVQTVEAKEMEQFRNSERERLLRQQLEEQSNNKLRQQRMDEMLAEQFDLLNEREKEQMRKQKEALLTQGRLLDGKQIENWQLGSRQELVRKQLGERLETIDSAELQKVLLAYNQAFIYNNTSVESYLDSLLLLGGDYSYLANKTIRAIAVEDMHRALDTSMLEPQTKDDIFDKLDEISEGKQAKTMYAGYRKVVKSIRSHIEKDPMLAPYTQAITTDPAYLQLLADGSKQEIAKLIKELRQSLTLNQSVVDDLCKTLEPSVREVTVDKIKQKLGVQLISASAVSVNAAVMRALDHLQLLHPQALQFGAALEKAAAAVGADPAVVQTFYSRNKETAMNGNDKEIEAQLTKMQKTLDANRPMLDKLLVKLLPRELEKQNERLRKQTKADSAAGVESSQAKLLKLKLTMLGKGGSGDAILQYLRHQAAPMMTETVSGKQLEKIAEELLEQYVSDELSKKVITEADSFGTSQAALPANIYEAELQKGLLEHPAMGEYLKPDGAFIMECINKQIAVDHPGGIENATQLTRLKVPQLYDYLAVLQERLSLVVPILSKHPEYSSSQAVRTALMEKVISGEITKRSTLVEFAKSCYLDTMQKEEILKQKDLILSMGDCWESKRAFVNFYDQQINTSQRVEFRAVNRISRMRQAQTQGEAFDHKLPSFYEYYAQSCKQYWGKAPTPSQIDEIKKEWHALCKSWAGDVKEKKEFVSRLSSEGEPYYGLRDYTAPVLKGVGNSINSDSRSTYERKLTQVGMQLMSRRTFLQNCCNDYRLDFRQMSALEKNLESRFADSETEIAAMASLIRETSPQLSDEELNARAIAKLESNFQAMAIQTVMAWSSVRAKNSVRSKQELERIRDMEQLVLRKDKRCNSIASVEDGILTPLLPLLMQNKQYSDTIVGGSDKEFEQMYQKLIANASGAMRVLTQPKSVFYSFIDQYLHDFGNQILDGKITEKDAGSLFTDYYANTLATFDFNHSKDNPVSIQSIMRKALGVSANARTELQSQEGNLITMVSLYEGVLAISDKKKLEVYRGRLAQNQEILQQQLDAIVKTEQFQSYAKLDGKLATGLATQGEQRAEALEKTFRENMRMHEQEFMVITDSAKDYAYECNQRMQTMLRLSQEQLETSDFIIAKHKEVEQTAETTILADKRAGRELLRSEREACQPYLDKVAQKISPMQAAVGITALQPEQLERAEKLRGKLTGTAAAQKLSYDLMLSCIARNMEVNENNVKVLSSNVNRVMERYGTPTELADQVIVMRLLAGLDNPLQEMYEGHLKLSDIRQEKAEQVGELLDKLVKLKGALPTDGCLNAYFADIVTRSTYRAVNETTDCREELNNALMLVGNRIRMVAAIDGAIAKLNPLPAETEQQQLRSGLFDLYAVEFSTVVVDERAMQERILGRLEGTNYNLDRNYIMDDRGAYASLDSDHGSGESSVFSAQMTRDDFEAELVQYAKKDKAALQQYANLGIQEKVLFGLVVSNDSSMQDVSSLSYSMNLLYDLQNKEAVSGDIKSQLNDYRMGKPLTISADYAQVKRRLITGNKLETRTFNQALAIVKGLAADRLKNNLNLGLLGYSSKQSQQLAGQTPPDDLQSPEEFMPTLNKLCSGDKSMNRANRDLLGVVSRLKPYELQLLATLLADRTVLDNRTADNTVVNKDKRARLENLLQQDTDRLLADEPAGADLLNQALQSLCSYQIRDDRVITGELQRDDIVQGRKTWIDFDLLKKGLQLLHNLHPDSLRLTAVRQANSLAQYQAGPQQEAYNNGVEQIKSPQELLDFMQRQAAVDRQDVIWQSVAKLETSERNLLLSLLGKRWLVDKSRDAKTAARKPGTADPEGTQELLEEYKKKGNVTIDYSTAVREAFCGVLSSQINDDPASMEKQRICEDNRRTAIDWRLVQSALAMVSQAHDERAQQRKRPSPLED